MLPGTGWCGAGFPPFTTACWWLTRPAVITGVSVSARRDSPGGCGGPSNAIGVVCHQLGLLCTDLHAICCGGLFKVI